MTEQDSRTPEKSDRQLIEELHERFQLVDALVADLRPLIEAVRRNSVLRGFLGIKE